MKQTSIALACLVLSTMAGCGFGDGADRPNIILIMADDLGYSDVGAFGGEIETPNLDLLAAGGMRLKRFYNSAACNATRASVMSGQYWQDVGQSMPDGPTLGHVMQDAGYRTLAVGKWHLSGDPMSRGFDRFFGHLDAWTDHLRTGASYRLDRNLYHAPKDGFYSTDANADFAVKFLEEANRDHSDQPFFLYLAFNAPGGSLQALPEDIEKYRGRYRIGWDEVRRQRYSRQIDLGIVDPQWALPPRPGTVPAWDELTDEEKDFEDQRMSIYAAMVDRMDQAIGRVVASLRDMGELDNTLILVHSDSGANPHDRQPDRNASLFDAPWNLGFGWGQATGTPFRGVKGSMLNGGNNSPAIAHWPAVIKEVGAITDQLAHVIDLMATFIDIADTTWPSEFNGNRTNELPGKSLRPVFEGNTRSPHDALFFQLDHHRAVLSGQWKLVSDWGGAWQLFNMATDRTETIDLAEEQGRRASHLRKSWESWAAKSGVSLRREGNRPVYRHRSEGAVGRVRMSKDVHAAR